MAPSRVRVVKAPARVKRVQAFLADSASDYIAARVLFLSNLPQQAAILSSTAIEKALKAIMAVSGNESHGHLKKAHWNAVRAFDPELHARLNPDFLALNQKAYGLRYTDDLPMGFTLVVASREYLAELDHTLVSIHRAFQVEQSGESRHTFFGALLARNDPRLTSENHVLASQDKEAFVYASPQFIYEARNDPIRGFLEATYMSASRPIRPTFMREGLAFLDGNHMSYSFSHAPQSA
jgi:hypothetical protein